jgi:hypothetical protein
VANRRDPDIDALRAASQRTADLFFASYRDGLRLNHILETIRMDSNWIKEVAGVFVAVGVGVGIVIGIVVAIVTAALAWWLLPIL